MRIGAGFRRTLGLATLAAMLTLAPGRAGAQHGHGVRPGSGLGAGYGPGYGYGLGLGYGYGRFFNYGYPSPEESYLYQRSLQNGARATGPASRNAYANHPNAYYYHLHDESPLLSYQRRTGRDNEAILGWFADGPPPDRIASRRRVVERPAPVRPSPQSAEPDRRAAPGAIERAVAAARPRDLGRPPLPGPRVAARDLQLRRWTEAEAVGVDDRGPRGDR